MSDAIFFTLAGLIAAGVIALALVWPQGLGAPSPPPFGHPVVMEPAAAAAAAMEAEAARKAAEAAAQAPPPAAPRPPTPAPSAEPALRGPR